MLLQEEQFAFDLRTPPELEALLRRALKITPVVSRIRNADEPLKFHVCSCFCPSVCLYSLLSLRV